MTPFYRSLDGKTGHFWLAEQIHTTVPGRLVLRIGRWPRIELAGELMPSMKLETVRPDGIRTYIPADMGGEDLTVHGRLIGGGRITLLHAHVVRRAGDITGGLREQALEADYALIGAHIASPGAKFQQFRIRPRHMEEWAQLEGMQASVEESSRNVTITYEGPTRKSVPLASVGGSVTLKSHWSRPQPRFTGVSLTTRTFLYIDLTSGVTLPSVLNEYALPMRTLLTLTLGEDCPVVDVEVFDEESGRWLVVVSPGLGEDSDVSPKQPFLTLPQITPECMANWIGIFNKLSPLPQLVASAVTDPSRLISNSVLELATAAEGLHRRLHSDERQIGEEELTAAIEALRSSSLQEPAKKILLNALRLYLWEPSFPSRLAVLADECSTAAPRVVGRVSKWKRRVADTRVGFAHQIAKERMTAQEVQSYAVLRDSLRWLLTTRLLLEAGVPADTIAQQLGLHLPYQNFLRMAKEVLPDVYA
jgi:ApeA N-terminal domain 1